MATNFWRRPLSLLESRILVTWQEEEEDVGHFDFIKHDTILISILVGIPNSEKQSTCPFQSERISPVCS